MSEFIKVKNPSIETIDKLLANKHITVIGREYRDIIIRIHSNTEFIQL